MPIPKPVDTPENNLFLAALSRVAFEQLLPMLEHVELEPAQTLWGSEQKGSYLYFPTTSLISLNYESDTGSSVAIATIGRNGIVGTNLVLGNIRTPDKAVVQYRGSAYRMRTEVVENELAECGEFHTLLVTYSQALLTIISQNAICNRLHRIDQQLCRLLLDLSDNLQVDSFELTHDSIAAVLGVRRESVSLAAGQLQKRKILKVTRGKIRILDEAALSSASCECFQVTTSHTQQTLRKYSSDHN